MVDCKMRDYRYVRIANVGYYVIIIIVVAIVLCVLSLFDFVLPLW